MREYFILLSTDSKYLKPPQWVGRLISEEVMGNRVNGNWRNPRRTYWKVRWSWQYIHHLIKWESSPMLGMWQDSPFPCCHMQGSIEGTLCLFITFLEETLKGNIPFTEHPSQYVSSGEKEAEALESWWSFQKGLSAARSPKSSSVFHTCLVLPTAVFLGLLPLIFEVHFPVKMKYCAL